MSEEKKNNNDTNKKEKNPVTPKKSVKLPEPVLLKHSLENKDKESR